MEDGTPVLGKRKGTQRGKMGSKMGSRHMVSPQRCAASVEWAQRRLGTREKKTILNLCLFFSLTNIDLKPICFYVRNVVLTYFPAKPTARGRFLGVP